MKCVIPARIGSKRIKHKNFRDFCGRPIIEYSIEAARAARLFNDIVVCTDGPFTTSASHLARPPINDKQPLTEFLRWFCYETGYTDEFICLLYAANPFVTPYLLLEGYEKISRSVSANTVYCVDKETGKPAGMFWYVRTGDFCRSLLKNPFLEMEREVIPLDSWQAIDIDTKKDWAEAERNYRLRVLGLPE
jgi:CMP-N-acetylneuraminic acid synthetase